MTVTETRTGSVVGTLEDMAPEKSKGGASVFPSISTWIAVPTDQCRRILPR